ncbi:uncharacterized protein P884DRAFT_103729 [Thermothelomyces heterothallicus CBS 202.75]|uniref:uncharacterized protein n=1 Tax=Thermothelomyces heterothallicus CBS 202.75 TaxID=1149848 RepID=UPI00374476B9
MPSPPRPRSLATKCRPCVAFPRQPHQGVSASIPLAGGFAVARAAESVLCLDFPHPAPTSPPPGSTACTEYGSGTPLVDFTGFRCSPGTPSCCVWGLIRGSTSDGCMTVGKPERRCRTGVQQLFLERKIGIRIHDAVLVGPLLGRSPHNPDSHPSGHRHDSQVLSHHYPPFSSSMPASLRPYVCALLPVSRSPPRADLTCLHRHTPWCVRGPGIHSFLLHVSIQSSW